MLCLLLDFLTSGWAIFPTLTTGKVKPLKSNICLEGVKALQLQGTIGRANQLVAPTGGSAGHMSSDHKPCFLPVYLLNPVFMFKSPAATSGPPTASGIGE